MESKNCFVKNKKNNMKLFSTLLSHPIERVKLKKYSQVTTPVAAPSSWQFKTAKPAGFPSERTPLN